MSLWIFLKNKQVVHIPHKRTQQNFSPTQRASFCTCEKGSYTLEAAVVIPLVAIYLVTILYFFSILEIQCQVDEALFYAGRKVAVESSVVDSEELLLASAKAYLIHVLQDSEPIERHMKHGVLGITLWKSQVRGEGIVLNAEYIVELPFSVWGIREIELTSQNYFRKWLGDRELTEEGVVYISKYGEVYHTRLSCRSINLSVKETSLERIPSLRGKSGQKYHECGSCDWTDSRKERVYYTDYGTFFHKDIACSAIKRSIEKIKIEDVGERRPCKFCCEI